MSHVTRSRHRFPEPASRSIASRRGQRGLTLVELMIAVLVASLLVGFVFEIQGRMSGAFRSQTNIGSLQQGIRAANELIARDARLAGFMMPNGARVSAKFGGAPAGLTPGLVRSDALGNLVPALAVANNPAGMPGDRMQPDRIHFFYADPDPVVQAVVQAIPSRTSVVVNDVTLFQPEDLVLFARRDPAVRFHPLGGNMPLLVNYFSCIVRLTNVDPGTSTLFFDDDSPGPFNTPTNDHCFVNSADEQEAISVGTQEKTQVFRLIARAYQIDTTRPAVGALERSETGGLGNGVADDWQEIGIGFVDLQISRRFVEEASDAADPDGDGNVRMDWYSSDPPAPPPIRQLTQVGIGLVARTVRSVDGVRGATVPVLTRGNPPTGTAANNPFGDAAGPKNLSHPEYNPEQEVPAGHHVYRQSATLVDIRNIGVSY
ncbi:MAG TPA: prepilin-type N-terminal cleavage/methylation domain-containing protein [Haliangium sp.]|nr:prepilin-type N-terminal cleavage/methylation domain-containing protein [Haliangium sp.]